MLCIECDFDYLCSIVAIKKVELVELKRADGGLIRQVGVLAAFIAARIDRLSFYRNR